MGGVDKLALEVGGHPMLDRVLAAVRPLCAAVVVVGPSRPTEVHGVTFVSEAEPGGGPVPAVAAGMAELAAAGAEPTADRAGGTTAPAHDAAITGVAVLAADLPLLTSAHLEVLFDALADPSVEAAAVVDERGRPNPLLAVHRADALRARLAGMDARLSGMAASRLLPPGVVPVTLDAAATLNVNRPADLDRARTLTGGPR